MLRRYLRWGSLNRSHLWLSFIGQHNLLGKILTSLFNLQMAFELSYLLNFSLLGLNNISRKNVGNLQILSLPALRIDIRQNLGMFTFELFRPCTSLFCFLKFFHVILG